MNIFLVLRHKTMITVKYVCQTCFFYKQNVYKHIQAQIGYAKHISQP